MIRTFFGDLKTTTGDDDNDASSEEDAEAEGEEDYQPSDSTLLSTSAPSSSSSSAQSGLPRNRGQVAQTPPPLPAGDAFSSSSIGPGALSTAFGAAQASPDPSVTSASPAPSLTDSESSGNTQGTERKKARKQPVQAKVTAMGVPPGSFVIHLLNK